MASLSKHQSHQVSQLSFMRGRGKKSISSCHYPQSLCCIFDLTSSLCWAGISGEEGVDLSTVVYVVYYLVFPKPPCPLFSPWTRTTRMAGVCPRRLLGSLEAYENVSDLPPVCFQVAPPPTTACSACLFGVVACYSVAGYRIGL